MATIYTNTSLGKEGKIDEGFSLLCNMHSF
ncbi:hypothetical protein FGB90_03830 [Alteribacter natronophilus]|nr:hypothetical protein FGB90_03830 [Alteribacter natronophilus]